MEALPHMSCHLHSSKTLEQCCCHRISQKTYHKNTPQRLMQYHWCYCMEDRAGNACVHPCHSKTPQDRKPLGYCKGRAHHGLGVCHHGFHKRGMHCKFFRGQIYQSRRDCLTCIQPQSLSQINPQTSSTCTACPCLESAHRYLCT